MSGIRTEKTLRITGPDRLFGEITGEGRYFLVAVGEGGCPSWYTYVDGMGFLRNDLRSGWYAFDQQGNPTRVFRVKEYGPETPIPFDTNIPAELLTDPTTISALKAQLDPTEDDQEYWIV